MFCKRTKEVAAQATAGEFQEETRNVEATVRIQQREQMFNGENEEKWSTTLTVSSFFVTGL
jgi:hypothetical protein